MTLHLFEGFGIELEYMIVDAETLSVRPVCDELLRSFAGSYVGDVERDGTEWSNELVAHLVELKTRGPASALLGLDRLFQRDVGDLDRRLASFGARLMPGAMHPWMNPDREMVLWPHGHNEVYAAFNRIFDCRGHGWANLQSMHVNLPFCGDEELGKLHAAIRLLLPIMPALAASSPVYGGVRGPVLDNRMEVYRHNSRRIPSLAGRVIPEQVYSRATYEALLRSLYADLAPHDPDGVLQDEFVNARGAIVRFSRSAIEIRVLDVQEHPAADIAIAALVVATLKALVGEAWSSTQAQQAWPVEALEPLLLACIRDGELARIDDPRYLSALGFRGPRATAQELWRHLYEAAGGTLDAHAAPLAVLLQQGPLARRLLTALAGDYAHARLGTVYRALCDCLRDGRPFA